MKIQINSTTRVILCLMLLASFIRVNVSYASTNEEAAHLSSLAAPQQVTYKITDGYGEYAGIAATKLEASAQARESCINNKVAAYESKMGMVPDADTADYFIDACINK